MAEVRKSATQTAARKRAREKAAAFREKQDKLEQLAVDYFVATDGLEAIREEIDRELAAVRARGDKRLAASQGEADRVIADMLGLGVPRNEVADRLGVPTRDVKKTSTARKAAASSTTPAPSSESGEVMDGEHSEVPGAA
ncbi:hypothetical protein EDF46_3383 [Frondihabitans sp. PhB188]|uniref:hypothetical protein n=1 Tax=Frondihabitans sp. PhB188 TaxID=2485200 RepID=UPI000F4647D7|nr:hypothetical protein [Frondihabitans sp. PhB188]ROQ30873.1 hypothetical protein EDF46_3383 [Frondihabitans sp. PhB188]